MIAYTNGESAGRPWGYWRVLGVQPNAVIKHLEINPHSRLSLQRHAHRAERWIVTGGVATVQRGEEHFELQPGESVLIPRGEWHRLGNAGDSPVSIIEVQMGDLLDETDIERLEDDYCRPSTIARA